MPTDIPLFVSVFFRPNWSFPLQRLEFLFVQTKVWSLPNSSFTLSKFVRLHFCQVLSSLWRKIIIGAIISFHRFYHSLLFVLLLCEVMKQCKQKPQKKWRKCFFWWKMSKNWTLFGSPVLFFLCFLPHTAVLFTHRMRILPLIEK